MTRRELLVLPLPGCAAAVTLHGQAKRGIPERSVYVATPADDVIVVDSSRRPWAIILADRIGVTTIKKISPDRNLIEVRFGGHVMKLSHQFDSVTIESPGWPLFRNPAEPLAVRMLA